MSIFSVLPGDLGIILGNGSGTFQPAVTYAASGNPEDLEMADFNGDGNQDPLLTNASSTGTPWGRDLVRLAVDIRERDCDRVGAGGRELAGQPSLDRVEGDSRRQARDRDGKRVAVDFVRGNGERIVD